mmetsp:Transcript_3561/g.5971  ORF Transcript_3561/g.5971 Transcript_3561/m.5971 type:complete len:190 (-) Transcript_3561:256-825(-)
MIMSIRTVLLPLLLVVLLFVAGSEGARSDEEQTLFGEQAQQHGTAVSSRLMEMLTYVGIEYDRNTITPDEIKRLVKKHKVISQYAKLKQSSSTSSADGEDDDGKMTSHKKTKGRKRNARSDDSQIRTTKRRRPGADYSYIADPVKRGLLERISKKGIVPHADEMTVEQLERIEETMLKSARPKEADNEL